MHSKPFEKFLHEFNSTGRDKMDGYTLTYFDNMSESEKALAFHMSRQEFETSSVAIDPMHYLNKGEAYLMFKKKYFEQKANGHVNFHLVAKIWDSEKSDYYAEEFGSCYACVNELSLISYIDDAEKINHPASLAVLTRIIFESENQYFRKHAAKALLNKANNSDEKHRVGIFNGLTSNDIYLRRSAVENLYRYL